MANPSFEEWLDEYPERRELVAAIEQNTGGPLSPELKSFLVDSSYRNAQQSQSTRSWLERICGLCHRLLSGVSSDAERVLFWIYLHGVVHELYERENENRAIIMMIPWQRPYINALDAVRDCFTEAELSFVRFMRHNHVHILVDYPWQSAKAKAGEMPKIKEAKDPNAIENAEAILSKYKNDQKAAAIDFAGKVTKAVETLYVARADATTL